MYGNFNTGLTLQFEQTYSNCLDAYKTAGFISPKDHNPVKIITSGDSELSCDFGNLYEQSSKCPKGWTGKADDENCYKIQTFPETNNGASRFCYQDGSELLQVEIFLK